jgi:parallel beta-helix repeat protein
VPLSRRSILAVSLCVALAALALAFTWYGKNRTAPSGAFGTLEVAVTSGADRGPGSLREALFVIATAKTDARISVRVPRIAVETALPPLVAAHDVSIVATQPDATIDAHALRGAAVFDVAAARVALRGLHIRDCSGAGILVRASRLHLESTTIESCDVGVDVAENATDILLERNRFVANRIGVRFGASSRNSALVKNEFTGDKDAGLWAVRSEPDSASSAISVRDNRFLAERAGIVAGNVSLIIEHNEFGDAREAAVHVIGAGAIVRDNRVTSGASMGIIAENARGAVIEGNEIEGLAAYGILVRGSANTLVRGNRLHNCGYGLAFVLGDARSPSTAVENTILEPKFNGIDVIGDSPILRRNQVLRPHALSLHVEDFTPAGGGTIKAQPFLDNNAFGSAAIVHDRERRPAPPSR